MSKLSEGRTAAWLKAVKIMIALVKKKGNNDGSGGDDPDDRELVRGFDPDRADGRQYETYESKEGLKEGPEGGPGRGPGEGPEGGPGRGPEQNAYTTSAQDETFEEMIARAKALPDNLIDGEDCIQYREEDDLML